MVVSVCLFLIMGYLCQMVRLKKDKIQCKIAVIIFKSPGLSTDTLILIGIPTTEKLQTGLDQKLYHYLYQLQPFIQ